MRSYAYLHRYAQIRDRGGTMCTPPPGPNRVKGGGWWFGGGGGWGESVEVGKIAKGSSRVKKDAIKTFLNISGPFQVPWSWRHISDKKGRRLLSAMWRRCLPCREGSVKILLVISYHPPSKSQDPLNHDNPLREDINKKNVFFRALPESPNPHPLTPIRATWSSFLDVKNDVFWWW